MARVTCDQLAKNNTRDSCWVAINGRVWDVTKFLFEHPGGADVILRLAGKDATESYSTFHDPSLVSETLSPSCCMGTIDTGKISIPQFERPAKTQTERLAPLRSMINLFDFQVSAERTMTPLAWAYVSSGADDEITMNANALAYQRIFLRGRVLRPVSTIDVTTTILGQRSSLPIYTSPVGLGKLVHPDGECAIAAADGKEGIIQVVNTVSSMPIEEIMNARVSKDQPVFWQLYANSDLEKSKAFVERVERAGVKAIWLTVDSPVTGNRERDERRASLDADVDESFESVVESSHSGGVAASNTSFVNADLDWNIVKWLRSITRLPIVVKGIMCFEDAVLAFEHGVDGIVLSNHGGRSQDTSQPPLLTLLEIRAHAPHILGKQMQIFVDGGVRRGTDVLKALCLGATAVGIGRPVLFSMSGYGKYGIRRMIQILRKEMQINMAYLGAKEIADLRPGMVNAKPLERTMFSSPRL